MKTRILLCTCCTVLSLFAAPRADREARVDAGGVLRWTDDKAEVALVGINYYPPFTVDFKALTERGADIRQVMREDVAHFRRLGLGVVRIHCFDREFSRADGAFVDNIHVELLDYLIDLCAENNIYMVLTPIAWWGGHYAPGDVDGFSNHFDMKEMTGDRRSWPIQARFLKEFASHVNRFTHKRYADDPAILAFECINEPLYPKDHPDAEVTAYVNTLVDGLRASGTAKPIYYNSWQNRNAAVGASRVDGVTGSYYPTGLVAGHALEGSQLGRIRASSLRPDAFLARKSRLIYEFDAADTPGSYMYPAMGQLFRHEGVQVAAMFQYDPLPIANVNTGWKTHHLNLVYTPAKAISIAIMAETFKHLPRACCYTNDGKRIVFPPFRVDATLDLSEYVTGDAYYYTNDPVTPPKNPAELHRIWGCGKSSVAASTGNGAYFLDRVAPGIWRLQLYPDIFTVADPYTGKPNVKEVVLATKPTFSVNLPDLGANWVATPTVGNGAPTLPGGSSRALAPGDYVLTASTPTAEQLAAARAFDLPAFVAPTAERPTTRFAARVPAQGVTGHPLTFTCSSVFANTITAELVRASDGTSRSFPISGASDNTPFTATLPPLAAGDWGISFTAQGPHGRVTLPDIHSDHVCWTRATNSSPVSLMPTTDVPLHPLQHNLGVTSIRRADGALVLRTDDSTAKDACSGFIVPLPGSSADLEVRAPKGPSRSAARMATALLLEIDNEGPGEARLEIGFRLPSKGGFGVNVHLRPGTNILTLDPEQIIPLWGGPKLERPWENIHELSILTGAWLWQGLPVPVQSVAIRKIARMEVTPGFRVHVCGSQRDWEFFDAKTALEHNVQGGGNRILKQAVLDDRGQLAYQLRVDGFMGQSSSVSFVHVANGDTYRKLFPRADSGQTLVLHARAVLPRTDKLEVVMVQTNGQCWGTTIPLTDQWRDIRIPLASLRYMKHWGLPDIPTTEKPDVRLIQSFNFCFGKWLFPTCADKPHAFEISSIRVEE